MAHPVVFFILYLLFLPADVTKEQQLTSSNNNVSVPVSVWAWLHCS